MKYFDLARIHTSRDILYKFVKSCGLDPELVGEEFAEGLQHRIYNYDGGAYVLKIPKISLLNSFYGVLHYDEVKNDLNLLNRLFPNFLVETHIHASSNFHLYAILQRKLTNFEYLSDHNFSQVDNDFRSLIQQNEKLAKWFERSVDFWGREGIISSIMKSFSKSRLSVELTNIVVNRSESGNLELKIIDTNLLRFGRKDLSFQRKMIDMSVYLASMYVFRQSKFL